MIVDVEDPDQVYTTEDLASGQNLIFAASGVTDGELLRASASSAPERAPNRSS